MAFKKPSFTNKHIELRFEDGEISIYATEIGLAKIIDLCQSLIENPSKGHIHFEDYDVLTESSLKGTIAIFKSNK